jgi:hypothetical protein
VAELQWVDFVSKHPRAHLVSAVVVPLRRPVQLRRLRSMLAKVILQQGSVSDFATGIVRTDNVEIQCGFSQKSDADLLARISKARTAPPRPGWASHRSFTLKAAREVALAGMLKPQEQREAN